MSKAKFRISKVYTHSMMHRGSVVSSLTVFPTRLLKVLGRVGIYAIPSDICDSDDTRLKYEDLAKIIITALRSLIR